MNKNLELNKKPVNIGLCYNISYSNSAIFRTEFEADQRYLEDKGRSYKDSAKFFYDFKNGLLLDWEQSIYDYLRPNDNMDFSLYCKEQFLFTRYKNNFDDYNEDIEFEFLDKINKTLAQCNSQDIFRLINPNDIKAVEQTVEGISAEELIRLPHYIQGQCIFSGVAINEPVVVKVKE